jgi:Holliday junction resolvasome RuvABC endonuclease subunit
MIIMGIDSATRLAGYGYMDFNVKTFEFKYISHGTIGNKQVKYPISLVTIPRRISDLITELRPSVVAIEAPNHTKGFGSTKAQMEMIGCIKRLLVQKNIPYTEIEAASLKRIVAGNGFASKEEVARVISDKLDIPFDKLAYVEYYKQGPKKGNIKGYATDGSDALGLALAFPFYIKEVNNQLDFKGV